MNRSALFVLLLLAVPGLATAEEVTVVDILAGGDPVLATVDGVPLRFSDLGDDGLAQRNKAIVGFDGKVDLLLQDQLAEVLAAREASAAGVPVEQWWEREIAARVAPVTDAEALAFFEENPPRASGDFEGLRERVVAHMEDQRETEARGMITDELRTRYRVELLLEPFRVDVSADDDPFRGSPTAPVTIVMFFDFQCGYCGKARATLDELLQTYPGQVRVVARDFPLPKHVRAEPVARAAACAQEQGLYWAYFDRLFDNPRQSSAEQLVEHATVLGLDTVAFSSCMDSDRHAAEMEHDHAEGTQIGVTGTPMFYVNGRPLSGAQPTSAFVEIIEDELARLR